MQCHEITQYHSKTSLFTVWLSNSFPLTTPYVYPVGLAAQSASVYLTVVVTIERYIVVCWALKARYVCTCRRAKLFIVIVCLCSLLYNASRFAEYDHVTIYFDEKVKQQFYKTFVFICSSYSSPC